MAYTKKNHIKEFIFPDQERTGKNTKAHHFLRQDKRAKKCARIGSVHPAPPEKMMRAQTSFTKTARSNSGNVHKRRTSQITLWVKPIVKAELERIALLEGLTVSASGAALLEKALQSNLDMKYGAFLEPIIEQTLSRHLKQQDTRIISLLVRIAFDSGQTRSIVTNVLGLQPDITPELLREIITESDKRAKGNITRITPQITELIEALEKWFFQPGGEGRPGS